MADQLSQGRRIGAALVAPIGWLAAIIDAPLKLWQRLTGLGGMAAHGRLLPRCRTWLVFGVFVLAPFVINFFYSTTSGNAFFLGGPRLRRHEQYQRLARLRQLSDPSTCREDLFWSAVHNTGLVRRCCRSR
jgi:alpha-1,4-digalacturonate transport system permease protein